MLWPCSSSLAPTAAAGKAELWKGQKEDGIGQTMNYYHKLATPTATTLNDALGITINVKASGNER